jgi:thiamine biosynthesis lipoprotein ApbE
MELYGISPASNVLRDSCTGSEMIQTVATTVNNVACKACVPVSVVVVANKNHDGDRSATALSTMHSNDNGKVNVVLFSN